MMIMNGMLPKFVKSVVITAFFFFTPLLAFSQIVLEDQNEDGEIRALAIGDSITFGLGDGIPSGAFVENAPFVSGATGYPGRLEQLLTIQISNRGIPGEILTEELPTRFAAEVINARADYVFILEGSNDAIFLTESVLYRANLQKLINIAKNLNVIPILLTIPPTYSDRESLRPFLLSYSSEVRELAAVNGLVFADIEAAFTQSCPSSFSCPLINTPEGLHPNISGYDLIARTIAEAITGEVIEESDTEQEEE